MKRTIFTIIFISCTTCFPLWNLCTINDWTIIQTRCDQGPACQFKSGSLAVSGYPPSNSYQNQMLQFNGPFLDSINDAFVCGLLLSSGINSIQTSISCLQFQGNNYTLNHSLPFDASNLVHIEIPHTYPEEVEMNIELISPTGVQCNATVVGHQMSSIEYCSL